MEHTVTTPWRSEDSLNTTEEIAAYLEAAFEDGDPELIGHALGVVSRSMGLAEIARRTGLDYADLNTALSSEEHLEFATVLKVVRALGFKVTLAAE